MANPLEDSYGRRSAAPRILPTQNQEITTVSTQQTIKKEESPAIPRPVESNPNPWNVQVTKEPIKQNSISTTSSSPKLPQRKESVLLSSLKKKTPMAFNSQFSFRLGEIALTTPSGKEIVVNVQQELNDLVGNNNVDKTLVVRFLIAKSILIEKGEWK